ncbi:MAG: sugar MFS transporter [Bdellovibrionales bacterium]
MPSLVLVSYASLFFLGLIDNIRGPFYPEILESFQLTSTRGSWFFAITSLFGFLGSWLSHRLVHRYSSLALLQVSSVIFALGFLAISQSSTAPMLWASCAIFGLAFGCLNLAQNSLVGEAAPLAHRRRVFAGLHSMYSLAAMAAPLVASGFRQLGWTWPSVFLTLAGLPVVGVVVVALKRISSRSANQDREPPRSLRPEEKRLLPLYALMMAGYLWGEISVTTRMVYWLRTDHGFTPDAANFCMAGFCTLFLAGRVLFSLVSFHKWDNWRILLVCAAGSSLFMLGGLAIHPFVMMLAGLTLAPFFPVAMEQANVRFGAGAAQAMGSIIGFGSLSIVLMHLSVGFISDRASISTALYLCAGILMLVSALLAIRVWSASRQVSVNV